MSWLATVSRHSNFSADLIGEYDDFPYPRSKTQAALFLNTLFLNTLTCRSVAP
jgi:hypothetical protein